MKRFGYILLTTIVCILLMLTMLLCLIGNSKIQTALVQVVTQELSRGLQHDVQIGKVDYKLFNRLQITDIYIEDAVNDTLLAVDTLDAHFDFIGFFRKEILFREVSLHGVTGKIYPIANGEMNFAYLQKAFVRERQRELTLPHVEVKNVTITDGRLRLWDYYLQDVQTTMGLNCLNADSLHAEIEYMHFTEPNGLRLDNLSAQLIANNTGAWMPRLRIELPASKLEAQVVEVHFLQDSTASLFDQLLHLRDTAVLAETEVSLQITHARLSPMDIRRFVPALKNMTGVVDFSGTLSGTIGELHAKNLAVDYANYEILRGNMSLYGFPHRDAYIRANLQDLRLEKSLVQDVISDLQNKPYQLPRNIAQLGVVHYRGKIDGQLDSLALHGAFSTKLGVVRTEGTLCATHNFEELLFTGAVETKRFALGKLLEQKDLGDIALNTEIHLHIDSTKQVSVDLCANLPFVNYLGYTYQNAHIDGTYKTGMFEGKMAIDDEHVGVHFDGVVDLTQRQPLFNFALHVSHFHMGALNLSEKYADSDIRFGLQLNATGNSPDNVNGMVQIDTLLFRNKEKQLQLPELKVIAETGEHTSLKIQSEFVNANISGKYTYTTLWNTLQGIVMQYVPRGFSAQERELVLHSNRNNEIDFYAYLKDIDKVCDVLELPLSMAGFPTIKGFVNERDNQFALQLMIPELRLSKQRMNDITLNVDNEENQFNLSLYMLKRAGKNPAGRRVGDLTCLLQSSARNDSLFVEFDFTNNDSVLNAGSLLLQTHFSQYASQPLVDIELLPSTVTLNDSIWHIGNSHLIYTAADTALQVNHFSFASSDRYIYADGTASTRDTDSIRVDLQDIVLDYILEYTEVADAKISFGGAVTGWAVAYGLFSSPKFEADVRMNQASINGGLLGDATATARWNRERKTVDIFGEVVEYGDTIASAIGIVTPAERAWDLDIHADSANLAFINGWTEGILDDIEGRGYGRIHVFGKNKKTWVEGRAFAKNAGIGLDILGTKYYFTDSVFIDINKIRFENIQLHDKDGNQLMVNGSVNHDSLFHDFSYNIDIDCQQALVMDLPQTKNDMFYGKVYATGNARIVGNEQECRISANARTDANTDFYLSLATASSARDNSFITFVDHQAFETEAKQEDVTPKSTTKVLLDLQIEATPNAALTLIIDDKTGDHLSARGEGNMKLSYDLSTDDIKLYGNYALNTGSFFFTFQNVIRKEFTIREGSRVFFTGDPMAVQIDASAAYSTTASLRDLFGTDYSQVSTNRSSVPVNCILYLKDQLMNPTLSFGIELPQSDESVNSQVRSVISTEDMMMRQILYLLVFNRFYTPEYLQANTNNVGLNETYSLLSSTVTGQINNWLSKMTDDFTIGFNMRADGQGADASQEYETQFQYQPNNRLLINGNFGYRYNDISNQPLFGNLDVEYILTPSGHWRAKAYTHTVDKYSLKEANTVQGVGFLFKYDFGGQDKKKKEHKRKKQDTTNVVPADTTVIQIVE